MKRMSWLICVLVVTGLLLGACAPAAAPVQPTKAPEQGSEQEPAATPEVTGPKKGGTLIAAYATDAKGVDPHKATNFSAFRVLELTYDTLLAFDEDLNVVPNLAKSWKWSDDLKTLTMTLQQGIKFHSGNPLTSEDVKFSFERILDEETGAAARSYFTTIDTMETPDAETIVFKLSEPAVSILAAMTNPNSAIIDKKAVSEGADPSKEDVGSGPFKLDKWEPNQKLTMVANEDYWIEGLPYLDGIEFRTLPDESSILAALRTKQIDWAIIADPRVAVSANASGDTLNIARAPNLNYHVMQLNPTRPVFQDPRVRQAIAYAIDRQEVLDVASFSEGEVVGAVTPPTYRTPLSDLPTYTPNLEKAKELLAEAGVSSGLKFTILLTPEEMPVTVAEAQSIQAQLKKIGIETEIETVELGVYVDRWFAMDFDATITENGGNPDPDVMLYRYWHSTGNLQSVTEFNTPEIDQLLTEARTTADVEQRKALYTEIAKQLDDATPWVWLYVGYQYRIMQPYVMGHILPANGSAMYLREVWLDK